MIVTYVMYVILFLPVFRTPRGVVIDRQMGLSSEEGIINTHFTFPVIVMTGNWSIVASYGHEVRNQSTQYDVSISCKRRCYPLRLALYNSSFHSLVCLTQRS